METGTHYRLGGQKAEFPYYYAETFDDVVKLLKIREYFSDFDTDLLKFALYGDGLFDAKVCEYDNSLLQRLNNKYCLDICDNRILEIHGDNVLNTIVGDKLLDYFKLILNPKQYHILVRDITSNYDLTAIAYDIGVCRYLGVSEPNQISDKHNICGNCIENLIGALSYYYGLEATKTIKEWFFSFPVVLTVLGHNMREAVKKFNLESKVSCLQKDRYSIDDYFVLTDIPRVYEYTSNNAYDDIVLFVEKTGYQIEEETGRGRVKIILTDPHNRFNPFDIASHTGPFYDNYRMTLFEDALARLITSGFWAIPISREANSLRKRVTRSDNFNL